MSQQKTYKDFIRNKEKNIPSFSSTGFSNKGYSFKEWNTRSDGGGDSYVDKELISLSDDITTLYAIWTPISYNIIYDLQGKGENPTSNPKSYDVKSSDIYLQNPTPNEGYEFKEWQPTNSIPSGSTGNKTFTAYWDTKTYTISYKLDGGTNNPTNPTQYTIESEDITLQDPTYDGHRFNGWSPTNSIPSGSTGDKTFTAQWLDNATKIIFNANGGTINGKQTLERIYNFNDRLKELPTPIDENDSTYGKGSFAGWFTNSKYEMGTKASENTIVSDEITYYAHWNRNIQYKRVNNPNASATKQQVSIQYGIASNFNANTYLKSIQTIPLENSSLIASFASKQDITSSQNILKFNDNEWKFGIGNGKLIWLGNNESSLTLKSNSDYSTRMNIEDNRITCQYKNADGKWETDKIVDLPSRIPTSDCIFGGNDDSVENHFKGTINLNETYLLKNGYKYSFVPKMCKINYDAHYEGASPIPSMNLIAGSWYEFPSNPTREEYLFDGWYLDEDNKEITENDFVPDDKNEVTLQARWKSDTLTLTFDGNGGTPATQSINVKYLGTLDELPPCTREDYIFKNWNTKQDGTGNILYLDTQITEECTYYAQWRADTIIVDFDRNWGYEVTFNANGGEFDDGSDELEIIVEQGSTFKELPTCTYDGHTFKEWNTKEDGSGDTLTTDTTITEDCDYYAIWQ